MKNIILVSHYSGAPGGPVDKLFDFLSQTNKIINVKHPLFPNTDTKSSIAFLNRVVEFKMPAAFQFLLEGLFTLYYLKKYATNIKMDLAICFDSLSFTHLFLLRKLFKLDKIIFYNCDYSKKRFPNPIMNFIYQTTNYFAYKNCDYFFSLSARFIEDIDALKIYSYKNYIISGMVDLNSINIKVNPHPNSLVYAGAIGYGSVDFEPLLSALRKLKREKIKFQLDIYGNENPQSDLRKKISDLSLEDCVSLKGALDNKKLVKSVLPKYQIGLAPYARKEDKSAPDHTFLATDLTAKLVDYIAAGLPVITTEINNGFKEIERNQFGFLVSNSEEWYERIKLLLSNNRLRAQYNKNALKYAKKYDIASIINPILKRILS